MASFIRFRWDVVQELIVKSEAWGKQKGVLRSELAVALVNAGLCILSDGMDEIQIRTIIEQSMLSTADIRAATTERWKRTGFPGGHDGGRGTS